MAHSAEKQFNLVAATFTPFTSEGELNLAEIGPYVDYLTEKQGVNSIFGEASGQIALTCIFRQGGYRTGKPHLMNGTTGESMSLSVAERKTLAEEWCQKAKGRLQVIVHVGCMCLKESQELARHAEQIGADAIAVMAPFFFKPKTADVLKSVLKEVASAAPTLPLYYYHIPAITGITMPVREVLTDIEKLVPSFSGVKFSGTDLMDFGLCVSDSPPHWSFLYGVDEQLLAALAMGAQGAVGSTYNYLGCHVNKLLSAFKKGDLEQARTIQFKVQKLISNALKLGFDLGVNKQLMIEVSDLRLGPPRLPVMPCPQTVAQAIRREYHSIFNEC